MCSPTPLTQSWPGQLTEPHWSWKASTASYTSPPSPRNSRCSLQQVTYIGARGPLRVHLKSIVCSTRCVGEEITELHLHWGPLHGRTLVSQTNSHEHSSAMLETLQSVQEGKLVGINVGRTSTKPSPVSPVHSVQRHSNSLDCWTVTG